MRDVIDVERGRLAFWVETRTPEVGLSVVSYYCELVDERIVRQVGVEAWG